MFGRKDIFLKILPRLKFAEKYWLLVILKCPNFFSVGEKYFFGWRKKRGISQQINFMVKTLPIRNLTDMHLKILPMKGQLHIHTLVFNNPLIGFSKHENKFP
jgi:hypothetical protein